MGNIVKSRWGAWGAFAIVIAVMIITFSMRGEWWTFIDIFFAFLMVFFHLIAVYFNKIPAISKQLDLWALIFGVLTVLAIIGEYIAYAVIYGL